MPASQFFAMLESSRALRNQEYTRLCYISRASAVDDESFKDIVGWFDDLDNPAKAQPKKAHLSVEEGRYALMAAFGTDPRSSARRAPTH